MYQVLAEATEAVIGHLPGFVSANLHISLDRRHIANCAQWRSLEDLQAMMNNTTAQSHMKIAASLAESFQPVYYRLKDCLPAEPTA